MENVIYSVPFTDGIIQNTNGNYTSDVNTILTENLGNKHKGLVAALGLSFVYTVILLTGLIGNMCTCIIIRKNAYMHTTTNLYLFNLAISDMMILFVALPPEMYSIWEAYPWRFGQFFCIMKSFIMETTSYTSVLTILCFTIERYISVCHSVKVNRQQNTTRACKCIVIIWVISAVSALPFSIHTRTFYFLSDPRTGRPVDESLVCNIPHVWQDTMVTVFKLSTFFYFVLPLVIITMMYVLIGLKLKRSETQTTGSPQFAKSTVSSARGAVIRMLVAVVAAFFLCWAPYHAQRLMTLYVKHWNASLLEVQSNLFFVSGVFYFFSSTVNPILYNVLSRKFRRAFKRTLCESRPCYLLHILKYGFRDNGANENVSNHVDTPAQCIQECIHTYVDILSSEENQL
ncbi:hypothetical protein DPMN_182367 [Dreissena polymorpha]|uniref:G-protein coupled receptors family 1 profile domain-containing protein n=1 Tax=Dreissena polymorpha TaxID=45954 RepID=A0A9D4DE21_DREPO|nr:hypothetical protein DPMN_182367 [Dreissena polymorpha]